MCFAGRFVLFCLFGVCLFVCVFVCLFVGFYHTHAYYVQTVTRTDTHKQTRCVHALAFCFSFLKFTNGFVSVQQFNTHTHILSGVHFPDYLIVCLVDCFIVCFFVSFLVYLFVSFFVCCMLVCLVPRRAVPVCLACVCVCLLVCMFVFVCFSLCVVALHTA